MKRLGSAFATTLIATIFVAANWPRNLGTLKKWIVVAGIPFSFAQWSHDQLEFFDAQRLAADVLLACAMTGLVAYVCILRENREQQAAHRSAVG